MNKNMEMEVEILGPYTMMSAKSKKGVWSPSTNINHFLIESANLGNLEGVKFAVENGADLSPTLRAVQFNGILRLSSYIEIAISYTHVGKYYWVDKYLKQVRKEIYKRYIKEGDAKQDGCRRYVFTVDGSAIHNDP